MAVIVALAVIAVTVVVVLRSSAPDQAAAPAQQSVHLTVAGDMGTSPQALATLTALARLRPDAHVMVGDLAYSDKPESEWCDLVRARLGPTFPFEIVAGNHESDGDDGDIDRFAACLPNQIPGMVGSYGREYYYDLPTTQPLVRVINVSAGQVFPDGTWNYDVGDPHYTWTADAIDSARAAGIPWVVVATHFPCLSVSVYECPMPASFFSLLQDKNVDLVVTGHDHAYMRTQQLRSRTDSCPQLQPGTFAAGCVVDTDSHFASGAGTVFVTVGSGGAPLRDIDTKDSEYRYFASTSGANRNPTWGVLDLDITATGLRARFVRTAGGTFSDAFTIGAVPAAGATSGTSAGPRPGNSPYVASGTIWRVNDSGQDLGTAWRAAGYDDSSWQSGPTQLGYGDGDESTVLTAAGEPAGDRPLTTYARTTFDAGADVSLVRALTMRVLVDDGAVVYLNGREVWRFNIPPGPVSAATRASRYIAGAEEQQWRTVRIPAAALQPGVNTVAAEVHNDQQDSSDISFDLELLPSQ